MNEEGSAERAPLRRRGAVVGGVRRPSPAQLAAPPAGAAAAPARQRPAKGDRLVIDAGEHKGAARAARDPAAGWAARPCRPCRWNPETGTVRDGSRLNKLLLIRLDAPELDENAPVTDERLANPEPENWLQ